VRLESIRYYVSIAIARYSLIPDIYPDAMESILVPRFGDDINCTEFYNLMLILNHANRYVGLTVIGGSLGNTSSCDSGPFPSEARYISESC
jgi:hypothetical protein